MLSARGRGYATEAVAALVDIAARKGVRLVRGDTTHGNIASQRVMEKVGLSLVNRDGGLRHYELGLA